VLNSDSLLFFTVIPTFALSHDALFGGSTCSHFIRNYVLLKNGHPTEFQCYGILLFIHSCMMCRIHFHFLTSDLFVFFSSRRFFTLHVFKSEFQTALFYSNIVTIYQINSEIGFFILLEFETKLLEVVRIHTSHLR